MPDDIAAKLPGLKSEWEEGSAAALIEAFVWCAGNGLTFPKWLLDAVHDELVWTRTHRPRGEGRTGNSAAHEREQDKHRTRFRLMDTLLGFQQLEVEAGQRRRLNYTAAAREAQQVMGGKHFAWGTTDEICKSYRRLKITTFSGGV